MIPSGFQSWNEYFSFTLAREYLSLKTGKVYDYEKGVLEKTGRPLSRVVLKPLDFFLREIRNPLMHLSVTAGALFLTSILFYPAETWSIATRVFPFIKDIRPVHVHGAFYGISQGIILGLGMQGLGRLQNQTLMQAFKKKEIVPIPIGAKRIR